MDQMNVDEDGYGLLYTFYAAPNILMPFIIGILFDTFGSRKLLIASILISSLG